MSDLSARLTLLASHLERKAKLSDALAADHEANREAHEATRMKKRSDSARSFATDCLNAAKLLTAKAKRAAFVPPTWVEVNLYALDKFKTWPLEDLRAWYDHFESVGWKVNTKQMVDWKAAAANGYRRWLKDNPQAGPKTAGGPNWTPEKEKAWREYLSAEGRPYKTFTAEMGWVRDGFNATRREKQ